MASSHQQALTIAQQLAALRLTRFFLEGSGTRRSIEQGVTVLKSNRGPATDTTDTEAGALRWEMAQAAQSCAYLAHELQIWAEKSSDRMLPLPDSTYRLLSGSVVMLRLLLDIMQQKLHGINTKEDASEICVLSGPMAEAILSMLAAGSATIMVECMTSTESQETSSTADAGGMK